MTWTTGTFSWRARRGFSMVEAVACTLIVSVLFVAAVQAVSVSTGVQFKAAERARARALAAALLEEVLQQKYAPASAPASTAEPVSGSTESFAEHRFAFDDLGDYDGYFDSPPVHRDGTPVAGARGFSRRVKVRRVNVKDLTASTGAETGVKMVTVTVSRGNRTVLKLSALRGDAP